MGACSNTADTRTLKSNITDKQDKREVLLYSMDTFSNICGRTDGVVKFVEIRTDGTLKFWVRNRPSFRGGGILYG